MQSDLQNKRNLYQMPKAFLFFGAIEKSILKFIGNLRKPWVAKIILRKKNKVEGLKLPNSKTYHIATIIKRVCYLLKNIYRPMGQKRAQK